MADRFTDLVVNRRYRFSLGVDNQSGQYFLSTPISGSSRAVEFEAYYRIDAAEFEGFRTDPASAESFLETCRQQGNSDRRIA